MVKDYVPNNLINDTKVNGTMTLALEYDGSVPGPETIELFAEKEIQPDRLIDGISFCKVFDASMAIDNHPSIWVED